MDRKMELDHLAIAEKAVAKGERHIEREEQLIADLDRAGHDTKHARETLANFRRMQAEHVAHRDLLLKMLQEKPRLTNS
jgi:glutamine synthetase adenylyltransferase